MKLNKKATKTTRLFPLILALLVTLSAVLPVNGIHVHAAQELTGCNCTGGVSFAGSPINSTSCSLTATCDDCGSSKTVTQSHTYETVNGVKSCMWCGYSSGSSGGGGTGGVVCSHSSTEVFYVESNSSWHTRYVICNYCGEELSSGARAHTYGDPTYVQYDESQHEVSKSCTLCTYAKTSYEDHVDEDNDYLCDTCGYSSRVDGSVSVDLPGATVHALEVGQSDTLSITAHTGAALSAVSSDEAVVKAEVVNGNLVLTGVSASDPNKGMSGDHVAVTVTAGASGSYNEATTSVDVYVYDGPHIAVTYDPDSDCTTDVVAAVKVTDPMQYLDAEKQINSTKITGFDGVSLKEVAAPSVVWGDFNNDGSFTTRDSMMIAQYVAGSLSDAVLSTVNFECADVDGDGSISNWDADLIAQKYSGLIDRLPVECATFYEVIFEKNESASVTATDSRSKQNTLDLSVDWISRNITWNSNGGSDVAATKQLSNANVVLPAEPTRDGYTFKGWFTAASGGTQITSSTKFTATEDVTYYAQWTANTYTITWDAGTNGGTIDGSASITSEVKNGATTTVPSAVPVKKGYVFSGWYTSSSGGEQFTASMTHSANTTYYAQWTRVFSVAVPSSLPIGMDGDGNVYTADAEIANNSSDDIQVSSIVVNSKNGWSLAPYSSNMSDKKVDAKMVGFSLNGMGTTVSGSTETLNLTGDWTVGLNRAMEIDYDAVISASSEAITGAEILDVVFVVEWS